MIITNYYVLGNNKNEYINTEWDVRCKESICNNLKEATLFDNVEEAKEELKLYKYIVKFKEFNIYKLDINKKEVCV